MLAKDVLTEEWLADVLQDSLDVDWTSADGARAIMEALRSATILPQCGGQIATVALATQPATSQEGEIFRLAANLVYRIEAAGALEDEGRNFERWKTTARSLAPSLRAALAATPTPPTLSEDLREALLWIADRCAMLVGDEADGWEDMVKLENRARAALAQVKAS